MTASSTAFAPACVPNGSHCVAMGHQGKIGPDGMCRVMRAFVRDTKTCGLCRERPVMARAARVLNPIFVVGLIRGIVIPPIMRFNPDRARAYNAAILLQDQGFCNECLANVEPFINAEAHQGKVAFESGAKVPMFVGPDLLREIWGQLTVGPAKVAEAIMRGSRVEFGHQRGRGETAEAQCVVHRNLEKACLCGGWHPKSEMPTLAPRDNQVFGFGPMCAQAVRRAGYKLGDTMSEQLSALHTKKFLAELEARDAQRRRFEELAKEGVFVDARGIEHVGIEAIERAEADRRAHGLNKARELIAAGRHVPQALQALLDEESGGEQNGASEPVRRSKPRRASKAPMTGEEQMRALAARVALKKARQLESAKRREDPHYGECAKAPAAKQGKKKPAAGDNEDTRKKRKVA